MYLMPFHVDGADRIRGTEVLTGSATDAAFFIDSGYSGTTTIVLVKTHHLDCSDGTMAGTITAFDIVRKNQAVLLDPYGMSDLCAGFLLRRNRTDGSSRAYLGAAIALRSAVATLVAHRRLHECQQIGGRTQNLIRTLGDTELTASAMLTEMSCRETSRRCQRCLTLRCHLVLDVSKTSIHFNLLLCKGGCGQSGSRGEQECATGSVCLMGLSGLIGPIGPMGHIGLMGLMKPWRIVFQRTELTTVNAIATDHATGVIDGMVLIVDA